LEELEANYIKFYGHEMKVLQSDSEAVFKDEKIASWCTKRNIRTHLSPPYLHEANGKAERNIQTVVEMARTYMISANAPPNVWEYAVALAVHNLNLTPHCHLTIGNHPLS
jgi:transposase InsO family protein